MVPGWTSLIFSILGIGGVQLIILGVMGQYIGMIFEQVKNRPLYLLRSEVRYPRPDAALERDRVIGVDIERRSLGIVLPRVSDQPGIAS